MDEQQLNVKVIRTWGPTCDSGRHHPPHPGDTCDDIDDWIKHRNTILTDIYRRLFEQMLQSLDRAELAGTAFAAALADPIPQPERSDVQRALDILAPHLAWQPTYRPEETP